MGHLVAVGRPRSRWRSSLELIFFGYLLVRKYGGPGSEKLAAAMGIFGAATAPFVYKSVDWWRTIHPEDERHEHARRHLGRRDHVVRRCCSASVTFLLLFALLLAARMRLEKLRAELDRLYLAAED